MDSGTARLTRSVVIAAPQTVLYELCERIEGLGELLKDVQSVERTGARTHRWRAERGGEATSWETETTRSEPPSLIEWRTREHSGGLRMDGELSFQELPGGRTELRLVLNIQPGSEGSPLSALRETERIVDENLESFKAGAETRVETAPGEQRRLDADRAASMADEGGEAAARIAGGTPDPGERAGGG